MMVDKKIKSQPQVDDDLPGYVSFDDRGNAVWKWAPIDARKPDRIDETCNLLKSLENTELSLEDSRIIRGRAGIDPYNSKGTRSR